MITVHNVKKQRGPFQLSVNHTAFYDGLTLMIGENGAGKSTLLQLLATALFPDQGAMFYNRQTIQQELPLIRMDIGFLPTGMDLYEDMTAKKFLTYMCSLKGLRPHSEVPGLLDEFGLTPLANKKISKLSEGQRQRVAVAQAFLGRPRFVFLDEPLTSLDIAEQKRVLTYIAQYTRNRTVVVASHELNEWQDICHEICWLHNGNVAFQGTPAQWTAVQPHAIWAGEIPIQELAAISEDHLIHSRIKGDRAHIRVISEKNPAPDHFIETPPTIEDAYFIRKREDALSLTVRM